ncbi:hypothetical protein Athai_35380 [Actinocatenispora thailandica]|uniref:Leucine rich repeat variant n=2 Tax=Actinocatenispora thailandica TaxID=227318 RepID=A0A7R7DQZ7_9ACTN|nr:hypothetical protein Athai_35380 [Actinocatenispora thailandica]
MISSASEFLSLRYTSDPRYYERAAHDTADLRTWLDINGRYPEPRKRLANNKNVPLEVLSVLAADPDPGVRHMVATKRKLSAEIIERLAMDKDDSVRLQIARHSNASTSVLATLASGDWEMVADAARERLASFEDGNQS